jgi:dethiobiotin synthetase
MSYFITGTDTGVGKTLISCALLHHFSAQGRRVIGMKPVAAGCDAAGRNDDVEALRAASNVAANARLMNPWCFPQAIAPHIAAQQAGARIEFDRILSAWRELSAQADVIIVEGAGGFKIPLNDKQDSAELAQQFGLPVILVVGLRLGCLNHALLTADAIAASGLKLAAWVANTVDEQMPARDENIATLAQRLSAPLLGVIDYQPGVDARVVSRKLSGVM